MASPNLLSSLLLLLLLQALLTFLPPASAAGSNLFREYIGAEFKGVKFSDVPIDPGVEFHFILSFAIDYTTDSPAPTNGQFNVFWDSDNLSPSQLTSIIKQYNLDGIDIDYEHFQADPDTFAECIGQLLIRLKSNGVISFASIAPFDDEQVQSHYLALWRKYRHVIDHVNFQFYAYDASTTVSQFLSYFAKQSSNYNGGKVLASFATDGSGGLSLENGFFRACNSLRKQGKLHGIFVWSADDSMSNGFRYEKQSQNLLPSSR